MRRLIRVTFAFALVSAPLLAQVAAPVPGPAVVANATPAATVPAKPKSGLRLVVGKPYSLVQQYDRQQTTPEGKKVIVTETSYCWRDASGRSRRDVMGEKGKALRSFLSDPAAMADYRWTADEKVVYVTHKGPAVRGTDPTNPLKPGEVRQFETTSPNGSRIWGDYSLLPAETIEGQLTTGSHLVYYSDLLRNYAYYTRDVWMLPGYLIAMKEIITDTQYGRRQWQIVSFTAEEPAPTHFELPKGYPVKDAEAAQAEQFE